MKKYYSKLSTLIQMLNNWLKDPYSGKIFVYHHMVRRSGTFMIEDALKENGYLDNTMQPTKSTRCSICGVEYGKHPTVKAGGDILKKHEFMPARFVMAHSEMDKSNMRRNLELINSADNVYGYKYRIIIVY